MPTTATPLTHCSHPDHVVQLYGEDDRSLTASVTAFLGEGLAAGDGAVVIASEAHCDAFAASLAAADTSAVAAVRDGRLVFLDAATTLARFMVDGRPDWEGFVQVVGGVIETVETRAGRPGTRAYGEMVGLLWLAGQEEAAVRLEEFWNSFMASRSVRLFCGYPIDVFGEDFAARRLDPILRTHSRVLTVNGGLDRALDRAMDELLGSEAAAVRVGIETDRDPAWADLPRAEATVLWLRKHRADRVAAIVERARFYRAAYLHVP